MHHKLVTKPFNSMAPVLLTNLGPFLLTTLGIFELSIVYCPIRDNFHLVPLGNSQENMSKYHSISYVDQLANTLFIGVAKFNISVPTMDIRVFPRQVYIHKDVVDCVGSGEPTGEDTPSRVYFAVNSTSESVYAVEVTKLCVHVVSVHAYCLCVQFLQGMSKRFKHCNIGLYPN